MNAPAARAAARKFANRFKDKYPAAVDCFRNDLDELLTCYKSRNNAAEYELRMQSNDDSEKYGD